MPGAGSANNQGILFKGRAPVNAMWNSISDMQLTQSKIGRMQPPNKPGKLEKMVAGSYHFIGA